MTNETFKDIEKLESDLWEAADSLRANSKLTSNDYFMPVLGIIFLRHAANRFEAAERQIEADQASGKMPKRRVRPEDYVARRSLYLPEESRYDWIMQQAALGVSDLPSVVSDAMSTIEAEFEPLNGVLPKDYGIFERKVLEDLMSLFNSEQIRQATGDVFGCIYEYFLAKFSIQKAHDNGEFFTPSSLVQMIVNVIEPDHGTVFDPACGSGGMFVQSSHFIEREGGDTAKKVVYDFSPEQMQNLAAIVWLYRGQRQRFLGLLKHYLGQICTELQKIPSALGSFEMTLAGLRGRFDGLADAVAEHIRLDPEKKHGLADAVAELREAAALYEADAKKVLASLNCFDQKYCNSLPEENEAQHKARKEFDPIAEAIRGLVKQVDLLYKLAARLADQGTELAAEEAISSIYDRRAAGRMAKRLDEERKAAVEQLHQAVYFYRQVVWLQERFPEAELQAVPGVVKLVDGTDIEAADWSLTPGRYVGVPPPEEDEDFDFEQALRDIHTELADLNKEAVELAAKIQENSGEMGA
ncbi:MAG: type I restriction-modification system subunit M [Terriglobia bacterium]